MVKIDTSYGRISVKEPDGNVIDAKNIDELARLWQSYNTDHYICK